MNLMYTIYFCVIAEGNNKLSGSIPSEIGTIKSLSNCSLGKKSSSNIYVFAFISSTLSSDIVSHFYVDFRLNIDGNKLNGTIPTEIAEIQTLQVIDLGE